MPKRHSSEPGRPTSFRMRLASILIIAFVSGLGLSGCRQPQDEATGYRLRGERVQTPVGDWRFTNGVEEIFVQTTPWYWIPHSATIWCAEVDGQLYIGSYGPDGKKQWEHNVARNADARLRIADKLYDVTITPVSSDDLTRALDVAYAKKYDMADVFGNDLPEWWYYKVTPRD